MNNSIQNITQKLRRNYTTQTIRNRAANNTGTCTTGYNILHPHSKGITLHRKYPHTLYITEIYNARKLHGSIPIQCMNYK
jgi:hypothetical protein